MPSIKLKYLVFVTSSKFAYTLFLYITIYFIRISRVKSAKFQEYFKNKNDAEILKRISIISYSSLIVSVSPSAQRQTEWDLGRGLPSCQCVYRFFQGLLILFMTVVRSGSPHALTIRPLRRVWCLRELLRAIASPFLSI